MITKLFTEINEKMDEIEKILKDNNYFVNLEKKMKEYNDRIMAIHDNEATKYINRIDKAIEYIENKKDVTCCYEKNDDGYYTITELIPKKELLDILKGSDSND